MKLYRVVPVLLLSLLLLAGTILAQDDTDATLIDREIIEETATGEAVMYEVELEAEQVLILDLESDEFDTLVRLLNPDGDQVAEDDDGGSGLNSRLIYTVPESGTYTIEVNSFDEEPAGDYILAYVHADRGEVIEDTATGEAVTYEVELEAEQTLILELQSGEFDTLARLLNSDGDQVAEDDDGGDERNSLLIYTAPESGIYTMVVDSFGGEPEGDYVLVITIGAQADSGDAATDTASSEPCFVRTDEADSVRVRVGPGINRTAVTFLPAGEDLEVQGRTEVDGEVWYQLDAEDAAPGRAITEAWVSVENLDSTGDCENIVDAAAPPIVPIINQPPPQTGGDDGDNGAGAPPADTTGLIRPAAGTWTMSMAGTTNASCEGTGNVQIPTNEIFDDPISQESLSPSGDSFLLSGTPFTFIGNNTHQGQETVDDLTGTFFITFSSSTQASGRFITSFTVDGIGCSATIGFTMSR